MRFLHTGDWHVGKQLRGRSRADEHEAVLAEIASIADSEQVGAVLVAGDVFDSAVPPPDAERLVYRALLDLAEVAPVVVIAGNHDHARRLAAVAPLLELGRIRVLAEPIPAAAGGVVDLEVGTELLRLALVPFVSQRGIVRADDLMSGEASDRSPKYAERLRRVVDQLCAGFGPDTVNVVLAHLMVDGAVMGGGERTAHTIFEYAVPTSAFPVTAQYVALGHLHRAQELPGPTRIRYAGAPLQLDFGETAHTPSVSVVEARAGDPAAVRAVELSAGRRLRVLRGTPAELEALIGTTRDDWLRIHVQASRRAGLADEVRSWFPEAVDVVVEAPDDAAGGSARPARTGLAPRELFAAYLADDGVDDPRVLPVFDDLLESVSGGAP